MKKIILILVVWLNFKTFAQLQYHLVLPVSTNSLITIFTSTTNYQYHVASLNLSSTPKNLLFVFLPGLSGIPLDFNRIDSLAANMGYHSIGLMYPNSPSIGSLCALNNDSICFENTRLEIIDGVDRTSLVTVDTTNCIENRLIKLIQYLQINFPTENWGQYLTGNNQLIWNKIVIAGHSQGGGHAGIIAKYHKVKRVLFFASPKDYSQIYNQQAAWYNDPHLTSSIDYYGFSHSNDAVGSTFAQQLNCYNLLGMNNYGSLVNIDTSTTPYSNSHIFTSTISTVDPHGCVVADNAVGLNSNNTPIYRPVWYYMLNDAITEIKENPLNNNNMVIYPNPFVNKIKIKDLIGNEIFIITDIFGQKVYEGKNIIDEDFSNLNSGVYFFRILNDKQKRAVRIIK